MTLQEETTTEDRATLDTGAGTPPARPDEEQDPTGETPGEDGFLRIKRSHLYALLLPLTFVTGMASGFLLWGRGEPQPQETAAANPTQGPTRIQVSADDDPSLGPENAPITIIEFSDYNCPFCQRWHQDTFDELMAAYPNQIHFVYRDFPVVGGGAVGLVAAQAANCAGDQGVYWEFHSALFSNRLGLTRAAFESYATELNLDLDSFTECLESGRHAAEVEADLRYAAGLGVNGTPTFFINGIPVVGAQPLFRFVEVIDRELGP